MLEIRGNLWDHLGTADVICITTNGFVKRDGNAVMGRGCARQAATRYPQIQTTLGQHNRSQGWREPTFLMADQGTAIWSFPVKPKTLPAGSTSDLIVSHMRNKLNPAYPIPGWAAIASVDIICFSAKRLASHANNFNWSKVIVPRPGCGAGELSWAQIGPRLHQILDDRFCSITF